MTYREYADDISQSPKDQALMIASGKDHTVSLQGSNPLASGLEMLTFQAAPIVDEASSTTLKD